MVPRQLFDQCHRLRLLNEITLARKVTREPSGNRGGHAHKQLQQFIVAASGSFEVRLDDGREKRSVFLNRSYYGVVVPPMVWRELHNFSSGSVCLVMASDFYDRSDYIYDYDEFLKAVHAQ